jgi:hypothetical protein
MISGGDFLVVILAVGIVLAFFLLTRHFISRAAEEESDSQPGA